MIVLGTAALLAFSCTKDINERTIHEGSGLGSCERDLKKTCTGASFGKGFAVAGHDAAGCEAKVAAWAKSQV